MIHILLDPSTTPVAGTTSTQYAFYALSVATIVYIAVIRPMRKNKPQNDPLRRPPSRPLLAQQREVERDMGNLLVEYEAMIRRMTAQVDIRATKLEMLIRDADEKIRLLNAMSSAAKNVVTPPTADPVPVAQPPVLVEMATEIDPVVEQAPAAPRPHEEIYALADQGETARQIAHRLDRHVGEVELILALGGRRRSEPQAPVTSLAEGLGPVEADSVRTVDEESASRNQPDDDTPPAGAEAGEGSTDPDSPPGGLKGWREPRYSGF